MRCATGTNSDPLSLVTRVTKSIMARLLAPSFHEGRGSDCADATDATAKRITTATAVHLERIIRLNSSLHRVFCFGGCMQLFVMLGPLEIECRENSDDHQVQEDRRHGEPLIREVCVCDSKSNGWMARSRCERKRGTFGWFWSTQQVANDESHKSKGTKGEKRAVANQRKHRARHANQHRQRTQ